MGLALMAVALGGFVLVKTLWMLRQPEERRYRHPAESAVWVQLVVVALIPAFLFLIGEWIPGLVFLVLLVPMYWLARWNVKYVRYRQRQGKP